MSQMQRFKTHCMATQFRLTIPQGDQRDNGLIAEEMFDELRRLELLLSRFAPGAEIKRLNDAGLNQQVKVEPELFAVLEDCLKWNALTSGFFNPSYMSPNTDFQQVLTLDSTSGTATINFEESMIDLGGYGKGYALDRLNRIAQKYGLESALLDFGGSSLLSIGFAPERPWQARVEFTELQFAFQNEAVASSVLSNKPSGTVDIVDPVGGKPPQPLAITVVGPQALNTEVVATTAVAMGEERFREWFLYTDDARLAGMRFVTFDPTNPPAQPAWTNRNDV